MKYALYLLLLQGIFGAFDTFYHHEWQVKLPQLPEARKELRLHALRSLIYGIIFASLAWISWDGVFAFILVLLLAAEIVITMLDFIEEDKIRKLPASERVTHALMGIIYGGFLCFLIPNVFEWSHRETGWTSYHYGILSWLLFFSGIGVFLSGIRDGIASFKKYD